MSYESVVLHGRDHEAVTVVLPVPRLRTIYTHRYIYTHIYIYIYIGSGKRAYSALPPFYSPYTASIGDYQRSINRVATFPTFLARYSTVLTTVELEQARFPRSVYLRQTDLGKSWPRIKLIGIRRSLFNVIGEEGKRKKKGLKRNDLAMEKDGHAT